MKSVIPTLSSFLTSPSMCRYIIRTSAELRRVVTQPQFERLYDYGRETSVPRHTMKSALHLRLMQPTRAINWTQVTGLSPHELVRQCLVLDRAADESTRKRVLGAQVSVLGAFAIPILKADFVEASASLRVITSLLSYMRTDIPDFAYRHHTKRSSDTDDPVTEEDQYFLPAVHNVFHVAASALDYGLTPTCVEELVEGGGVFILESLSYGQDLELLTDRKGKPILFLINRVGVIFLPFRGLDAPFSDPDDAMHWTKPILDGLPKKSPTRAAYLKQLTIVVHRAIIRTPTDPLGAKAWRRVCQFVLPLTEIRESSKVENSAVCTTIGCDSVRPATMQCTACKGRYYCSTACQKR